MARPRDALGPRDIDTGTARLHVEEAGDGMPALVFLPDVGGSTRTWHPVIERLAGSARCVGIDHRGWAQSSAPRDRRAAT